MNSLDEFLMIESMLQKSEDSLIKHQRKKHKAELLSMEANLKSMNNAIGEDPNSEVEFLKSYVMNELNKHNDIQKRDVIIRKLSQRLYFELQDKEEIKKSEDIIAEELEDIKHQVKQFSSLVHKYKDSVNNGGGSKAAMRSSECQTNEICSSATFNQLLDESIEDCRRQDSSSSYRPHHREISSMIVDHDSPTGDDRDPNFEKLLLEQIKQYEVKIQSERQSYIDENERLSRINEENSRVIEQLKRQVKRMDSNSSSVASTISATTSTSSSSTTTATTLKSNGFFDGDDATKDYSRIQGLFDWPIEESIGDQVLAGDTVFDQTTSNAYNSTTNNRMLHVLSDLVKTFLDTENDIQKQLENLGLENNSSINTNTNTNNNNNKSSLRLDDSLHNNFTSLDDERNISELTFELCEDGPDLTVASSMVYTNQAASNGGANDIEDDVVLGASRRLRLAVERVLRILSDVVVRHHGQYDLKTVLKQKDDLALELLEEVTRRDKLTQQLLEKETMVLALEQEKRELLEQAIDYNEMKAEHEQLKLKLDEYEQDRDKFINDHKRLELEKSSFSQGLPLLHQKLVLENETLNRDIRQLQQDKMILMKRIDNLTSEIESVKVEKDQIIENKNVEFEELISQIQSSEKNLSSLKRFVEEQTQERELERDEYNKEVSTLKEISKEKEKIECKLKSQVRSLESQVTMLSDEKASKEEQIEELSANLKEANFKVSESNLMIRQLEADVERSTQVEQELQTKLTELSNSLNIRLNDKANWQDLIDAISKIAEAKRAESSSNAEPAAADSKQAESNDESSNNGDSLSQSDDSVFRTINTLNDKIRHLGGQVNSLMAKNDKLKDEVKQTGECAARLNEIKLQMEALEQALHGAQKENDLLHQEINENHMKYSELKVKLESSVDMSEFKKVVAELQTKLQAEKQQTESVGVKFEQANRHVHELNEKLDAHRKEIKTYKELIKSHELDNKLQKESKGDFKKKYENIVDEVSQLTAKLSSKEKAVMILEQKLEMFKGKLNTVCKEKDIYLEKLQSLDESQNKVVIYEKNLDKLRLQNKMSSDKITYLELEIKSLRKKIEILEKENDHLKIENHKLLKLKQDMSNAAAMMSSESDDNVDSAANGGLNVNTEFVACNLPLNSLDKLKGISSNNLLMLKVRRLLSQKGALIYQKNYLIHLLGGFQMTENATLALLANLNHTKDLDEYDGKMRGKQKFRSVAYALIALSRMRFMVNVWQSRKRQLFFNKMAHSISGNSQNLPVPPRRLSSSNATNSGNSSRLSPSSSSSSSSNSPIHFPKTSLTAQINSTMKDYVDRLHVVHETLGIHTNKL